MLRRGRLSLLAIGTIFLVVFASIHFGVQYSRGTLFDYESPSALEREIRAELWAAIDAERANRGLDPATRGTSVQVRAQDTARQLAAGGYFAGTPGVGLPEGNRSLPNRKGFCRQVPLKLTFVGSDGVRSGNATVTDGSIRTIARKATDMFAARGDVLDLTGGYVHGIGVVVRDGAVYVVYRACNLGY